MTLAPGDRVQLTRRFLRNTGQYTGPEGLSVWTVQDCQCGLCRTGRFVATDQVDEDDGTARHFNSGNLERTRRLI